MRARSRRQTQSAPRLLRGAPPGGQECLPKTVSGDIQFTQYTSSIITASFLSLGYLHGSHEHILAYCGLNRANPEFVGGDPFPWVGDNRNLCASRCPLLTYQNYLTSMQVWHRSLWRHPLSSVRGVTTILLSYPTSPLRRSLSSSGYACRFTHGEFCSSLAATAPKPSFHSHNLLHPLPCLSKTWRASRRHQVLPLPRFPPVHLRLESRPSQKLALLPAQVIVCN